MQNIKLYLQTSTFNKNVIEHDNLWLYRDRSPRNVIVLHLEILLNKEKNILSLKTQGLQVNVTCNK